MAIYMIVQSFVSFYFSFHIFCLDLSTAAFVVFQWSLVSFFSPQTVVTGWKCMVSGGNLLQFSTSYLLTRSCVFYTLSISWLMLSLYAFFRFGIFNPTIVYDHLGEIYSALIFGSFIFCIFLYIKVRVSSYAIGILINHYLIIWLISLTLMFYVYKGHLAPSSTDSGSCGNIIIDFYWVSFLGLYDFYICLCFLFIYYLQKCYLKSRHIEDQEITIYCDN